MKLRDFIQERGDDACAELFGVKKRTVGSWRRGERRPSTKMALAIVRKSEGKLTLDGVICDGETDPARI